MKQEKLVVDRLKKNTFWTTLAGGDIFYNSVDIINGSLDMFELSNRKVCCVQKIFYQVTTTSIQNVVQI